MNERFWSKVEITETCWLWTAGMCRGYGHYYISGYGQGRVRTVAHRYAYELLVGPVPEGLVLDHLCRVRNCVRPDHLEPVTQRENLLRGQTLAAENASKTHCSEGHDLADAYFAPDTNKRQCRICKNARSAERRAQRAESRN